MIDAVKRCWASLWTGRAIGYRGRQGIRPEDVGIAVVVQQLVLAEAAGVVFTANPVTGARDELVINAAWGLGEAIVSGRVTPDTIVINKQTGAITSQEIAGKEAMTVRTAEGTREEAVPADKRKTGRAGTVPSRGTGAGSARRSSSSTGRRWTSNGPCAAGVSSSCRRGP